MASVANMIGVSHFPKGGGTLHRKIMKIAVPKMASRYAPTINVSYGSGGVTVRNMLETSLYRKGGGYFI